METYFYNAYGVLKHLFKRNGNSFVGRFALDNNQAIQIPNIPVDVSSLYIYLLIIR